MPEGPTSPKPPVPPPHPDPDAWQRELKDSLLRAGDALARGIGPELAKAADEVRRGFEQAAEQARMNRHERRALKHKLRIQQALERAELKRKQREAKLAASSPADSRVYGGVAAVLVLLALVTGQFWLVFIALAFGLKSARIAQYHREHPTGAPLPTGTAAPQPVAVPPAPVAVPAPEPVRAPPAPVAAPPTPVDPRDARTDQLCDRLQVELKGAPDNLKSFLGGKPEETIEALRRTCHDLLRRERGLRVEASPEEQARLDREHKAMTERIAEQTDDVAKARLLSALAAIEEQREHRLVLLRNANRLDAEHVRLVWTLESLLAQIVRLRTSGADPGSLGLGHSVGQLKDQLNALADALEEVNGPKPRAPLADAVPPEAGAADEAAARRERERA